MNVFRISRLLSLFFLLFVFSLSLKSRADQFLMGRDFPQSPHFELTPGSLCDQPDRFRYPERIAYCERDVSSSEKWDVIHEYDKRFGYRISHMHRGNFKVDHLIPLCAGGSNEVSNLWPQHRELYTKTDRIEESVCRLMASGRMKQSEAVELVLKVKGQPASAAEILAELLEQLERGSHRSLFWNNFYDSIEDPDNLFE